MFSDPTLQRAEATIQKLRTDIQKLLRDESEARDRADRAAGALGHHPPVETSVRRGVRHCMALRPRAQGCS